MSLPTIAELHEALLHDDASGCLHWKKPQSNRARRGDVAGWVSGNGYRIVGIGGRQLYAHRVVFALCHGRWPSSVGHVS
jgi:hypothetical protein